MKIRIIWTALPQGLVAGASAPTARLAAVASIRVTEVGPQTPLAQAGPIAHWPTLIAGASFTALFEDGSTAPFAPHPDTGDNGTSAQWWDGLFPGDVPIDPFAFEARAAGQYRSYDPRPLAAAIDDLYGDWSLAATGPRPTLGDLTSRLRGFFGVPSVGISGVTAAYDGYAGALHAKQAVIADGGMKATEQALKDRMSKLPQLLDFHARLAAIGRHAPLLAKLRLALSGEVALPAGQAAGGKVAIVATWPAGAFTPGTLLPDGAVAVGFDAAFLPGDATPPASGLVARSGFCDLAASKVGTLTTDVDGAVRKLRAMQATADNQNAAGLRLGAEMVAAPGSPAAQEAYAGRFGNAPAGPPALATDGISLVVDRSAQLAAAFDRQAAMQQQLDGGAAVAKPGTGGASDAERMVRIDLPGAAQATVKGWRIDVREAGAAGPGAWRSLHRRTSGISATGGALKMSVPDEGSITTAAVQDGIDPAPDATQLVHPALAIWRGWSLSAPHPARTIGPSLGDEPDVAPASNPETPGLGLSVEHAGAAGLPRFRYGRSYQFRMRAMDLAGGGLGWDQAATPDWATTAPVLATRASPVAPPVPTYVRGAAANAAPEGPMAGGSIERMVIRTLDTGTQGLCRRLFYPPRVGVGAAEFHGMIDLPTGALDPGKYGMLMGRDHIDGAPGTTGSSHLQAQAVALEWDGFPNLAPVAGSEAKDQLVMSEARDPITYIPDPASPGMSFRLEPIRPSSVAPLPPGTYDYADAWPDRRPLMVSLTAGNAKPQIADGTLTIPLPPGEAATFVISSRVTEAARDALYVRQQAKRRAGPKNDLPAIDAAITAGGHAMAAPPRRVELVHAVQRPLSPPQALPAAIVPNTPALDGVTLRRKGDRDALVRIVADVHRNSTGEVALTASWRDPRDAAPDDPATDPDTVATQAAPAFIYRLGAADLTGPDFPDKPVSEGAVRIEGRHSLPDTRARTVIYHLTAATRFKEFMPKAIRNAPGQMVTEGGDARLWMLNSTVPPPPVIAYVVPTFAWPTPPAAPDGKTVRTRKGGGLRVYLARPWFVTGFNEMLAVVIEHCEVGQDPFYPAQAVFARPKPDVALTTPEQQSLNFTNPENPQHPPAWWSTPAGKVHAEERGRLPAAPFRTLLRPVWSAVATRTKNVAIHPVEWDAERGLWFADIVVDMYPPTAYPMIRLALARYQPMSVPMIVGGDVTDPGPTEKAETPPRIIYADAAGMAALPADPKTINEPFDLHLSEMVLTDFCQLLPDRTCSVTKNPDGTRTVIVSGRAGSAPNSPPPGLRLSVRMEQLNPNADPLTDWAEIAVEQIAQPLPPGALLAVLVKGPHGQPVPGRQFRLTVMEKDLETAAGLTDQVERLVYFDVFAA